MTDYDAILLVSFGGPEGPDDVVPFLENVTRGRGIPRERLAQVGAHYALFGGVSPINGQNRDLLDALRPALVAAGVDLPVVWGNRNWDPYLTDTLAELQAAGAHRVLAFVTSAYSSYSGCRQYRENLAAALPPEPSFQIDRIRQYFDHPGFVEPFVDSTVRALAELPDSVRVDARLVFTTHSIPVAAADESGALDVPGGAYLAQHRAVANLVAQGVRAETGVDYAWDLVFQSRSGPPTQAWLEPDISEHLEELSADGVPGAVIVPIGFVSDHMEVIYDLDTLAAETARELGLPMTRAATPGTDPRFVAMIVDLVQERLLARPSAERKALSPLGPWAEVCAPGCCPNPRGPRPALCGSD